MGRVVQVPQVDSWVPSPGHLVDPGLPEVSGHQCTRNTHSSFPGSALGTNLLPRPCFRCHSTASTSHVLPLPVLCLSPRPPSVTLSTASQFPCFCVLHRPSPSLSLSPDPFLCLILVSSPVYFFLPLSRFPFLALSATSPSLTSRICDSLLLPNSPTDPTHPTCRALGPPADWSGGSVQSPPISCLAGPPLSRT